MSIHNISKEAAEVVERNLDHMVRFAFFRTGSSVIALIHKISICIGGMLDLCV